MSTKWYWVIHGMLTSEHKASTLHFPIVIQQTLDPAARALKRQVPCRRLYMHSSTRQAQIRRRVGSTRRRGNHMHDHSRFQRDIEWRHRRLSLSLSLSLSLPLTKVTDAQYRKRFRASYNNLVQYSLPFSSFLLQSQPLPLRWSVVIVESVGNGEGLRAVDLSCCLCEARKIVRFTSLGFCGWPFYLHRNRWTCLLELQTITGMSPKCHLWTVALRSHRLSSLQLLCSNTR